MIRVLLAEDQHMIRGALIALLGLEDDIEIVAELDRGDGIVEAAGRTTPDVAVLDIELPGIDGLTAAGELRHVVPDCRVLILTGLAQPSHLLRALELQVRGFVPKDAPAHELASAIRRVHAGERVLDPTMVSAALATGQSPLTERESDVLRAASGGGTTADIGAQLHLSPATVRNYISNSVAKLGARNRLDAIRIAQDAGWL
ncbi:DNA-binding response regulator [Rhodococcus sp. RS1C4]|uniref:response regulator transcription factor n=1 Tax=Rhodococcus sp. 114MFTsu3.1 TaxID=1172184 RepID=UPI0003787D35|nr:MULTISPECIES: response regulator transcription factor [unclassified Rhodococcus (in: high G+C Gram-positive bacteria)]OZC55629.1 DNA-binding response regulator [Rhodococcus sp. 06-621-2]OZC57674.1 DNA-binding response regulator [Rhodococcus sp. RS1C4]OZC92931.1 DNA-binding response regulator [Rhodococcus sp. 06-418-1B]OZE87150.1 DNA-binding response regulator [Rhodococcus sp. 15-649-1-2]OZF09423.1 DNA-binding response regulator [Rhodococcus sp. 15-1154-1]